MLQHFYWLSAERYLIVASILFVLLVGCESKPVEMAYPNGNEFYGLDRIKLSGAGKKRAKQIWDSLSPKLMVDSTVRGYAYSSGKINPDTNGLLPILSFDYDSTFGVGNTKFSLTFFPPTRAPEGYMYFGDAMIIASGKSVFDGKISSFSDSLNIIVDRGLQQFLKKGGVRIDTDRGASIVPTTQQVQVIQEAVSACRALYLLNTPLNKPQPY